MRVAVIGSWRKDTKDFGWKLRNEEYFKHLCRKVGCCLAEDNHQLIVARTIRDETSNIADVFTAEGFKSIGNGQCKAVGNYERSKVWAKAHISCVQEADAVIVIGGSDGTYIAGQTAVMLRKRLIPIPFFGGAAEELCSDYRNKIDESVLSIEAPPDKLEVSFNWIDDLIEKILGSLNVFPRILIIHGRSDDKNQLKKVLKDPEYGINKHADPVIMSEFAQEAGSIPECFEKLASESDCAIAIITPDDMGCSVVDEKGESLRAIDVLGFSKRARQNIWVELGWFWGRLGKDRIMLLNKGDIEYPSDVGSLFRHTYNNSPIELKDEIYNFINKISSKPKIK